MNAPRVVLASASPRRRELLGHLGIPFDVSPSDVDETTNSDDPSEAAEELALRKAAAVAPLHGSSAVIGSDTIVALEGRMLGKPADTEDARSMLRALRSRTHNVLTGVAVILGDWQASSVVESRVTMRDYTDADIDAWIATGAAFDKAGAYASQDPVFRPAAAIDGCACSVVGLPLWTLHRLLRDAGVPSQAPSLDRCAACPAREG